MPLQGPYEAAVHIPPLRPYSEMQRTDSWWRSYGGAGIQAKCLVYQTWK